MDKLIVRKRVIFGAIAMLFGTVLPSEAKWVIRLFFSFSLKAVFLERAYTVRI